VAGDDALAAVQRITSNDAAKLKIGQIRPWPDHRAGRLRGRPAGLRLADAHFLLVVNAGNIAKDFAWISEQIKPAGDAVAVNSSSRYALIALRARPRARSCRR
jgi:aminomethyltransferase